MSEAGTTHNARPHHGHHTAAGGSTTGHAAHRDATHGPAGPAGHGGPGGHDKHAGHDPGMFRRKFWLSLALTIPLVATSGMVMDWFGYTLDVPGMSWVGPVLGSVVSSTAAGRSWSAACARSVTGRRG